MLFTTISDLKDVLEATLHLSRDALHVHIGMIIFIAVAALLRGRLRFVLAFGALLALCLVGEMADFSYAVRRGIAFNWLASAKDVVNTMFWPAIGLVAGVIAMAVRLHWYVRIPLLIAVFAAIGYSAAMSGMLLS